MASLRARVALHPDDMKARARLARLLVSVGQPGAALRELATVRKYGRLTSDDRRMLAELYLQRFRARLADGDELTHSDAREVQELAPSAGFGPGLKPTDKELAEAYFVAALAAYRRANQWSAPEARRWLQRAAQLAPGDPRLSGLDMDTAAIEDLGEYGRWLWRGNARRAALTALDQYVERGGREPFTLTSFVAARRWWGQADPRYRLDRYTRLELAGLGVSVCPASAAPTAVGCRGTLWSVAVGAADVAAEVRARATAAEWYVSGEELTAEDARAWAVLAIRGFLRGEGAATVWLREQVDVAQASNLGEMLGAASPLFLRSVGRFEEARRALERELRASAGHSRQDGERLLLAFELAIHRHERAAEFGAAPSTAGPLSDDFATLARLRARVSVLPAILGEPRRGNWTERWSDGASVDPQLFAIAGAYFYEPALADRKAREYVEGHVYVGRRAPAVAVLFAALGDEARSIYWWERAVDLSPRHSGHLFELACAAARMGDLPRARVHFTATSVDSGDAGAAAARAGRWLIRLGHDLEAIHLAKIALSVTAPAERAALVRSTSAAMERLGRTREAVLLSNTLPARRHRVSGGYRSGATLRDATDVEAALEWAGRKAGAGREGRDAMAVALAWNPGAERLQSALLSRVSIDEPLFDILVVNLFAKLSAAGAPSGDGFSPRAAAARRAALALATAFRGRDSRALRHKLARWTRAARRAAKNTSSQ